MKEEAGPRDFWAQTQKSHGCGGSDNEDGQWRATPLTRARSHEMDGHYTNDHDISLSFSIPPFSPAASLQSWYSPYGFILNKDEFFEKKISLLFIVAMENKSKGIHGDP
jgi:hypothetical protein